MYFDSKLNCKVQANHTASQASKALNILKVLSGTWWGGNPQALLNVYTGLIRSKMEYGIYLWGSNIVDLKDRHQKIQNNALRLAMRCRFFTPIKILHAES